MKNVMSLDSISAVAKDPGGFALLHAQSDCITCLEPVSAVWENFE